MVCLGVCNVGGVRKRSAQINAVPHQVVTTAIIEKAAILGVKKTKYASMILEKWFNEGCVPVTELDATARKIHERLSKKLKSAV